MGSLTLTTYNATVTTGADTLVNAGVDALVLTEYAASINAEQNITAGVDALTLTEYNATVGLDITIAASVDALTLTPYNATIGFDFVVTPNVDSLTLVSYNATIEFAGQVLAEEDRTGGSSKKRGRKYPRWVMIDGERYRVNSYAEELALLKRLSDEEEKRQAKLKGQEKALSVKKVARMSNRIKREQELRLEALRREDEEILLII